MSRIGNTSAKKLIWHEAMHPWLVSIDRPVTKPFSARNHRRKIPKLLPFAGAHSPSLHHNLSSRGCYHNRRREKLLVAHLTDSQSLTSSSGQLMTLLSRQHMPRAHGEETLSILRSFAAASLVGFAFFTGDDEAGSSRLSTRTRLPARLSPSCPSRTESSQLPGIFVSDFKRR
jgi:hypothetical protein